MADVVKASALCVVAGVGGCYGVGGVGHLVAFRLGDDVTEIVDIWRGA